MTPEPELSIVIVNYNEAAYLRYCLASIYGNPPTREFEIIVVDNDSSDGSLEMLASEFPSVRVIASGENLGFAGGNNVGFKAARGEFVFILNPDTVVLPDCIDLLVSYLEAHPRVGAVGPWIRDREPDILQEASTSNGPLGPEAERRALDRYRVTENVAVREKWVNRFGRVRMPILLGRLVARPHTDPTQAVEVDWVLNCASLIRRREVGREFLMDERWFIGTEEIEFCCGWLRPRGYEFFILPQAQVIHFGGRSYEGRPDWAARLYPLMHAAIYARRNEIFGPVSARVDALVGFFDHLALYGGLGLLQLLRPTPARREMMAIYRLLLPVNLRLFFRGASHADEINEEFRRWLPGAVEAR